MSNEFVVPTDEELTAALGVVPESNDDIGVRVLHLKSGDGFDVRVTTDALGRSVTVEVNRDRHVLMRIEREGAISMTVLDQSPAISVEFQTPATEGGLTIDLRPALQIAEHELLV